MKGILIATYRNETPARNGKYYLNKPAAITTVEINDCTQEGEGSAIQRRLNNLKGTSTLVSVVLVRADLTTKELYICAGHSAN